MSFLYAPEIWSMIIEFVEHPEHLFEAFNYHYFQQLLMPVHGMKLLMVALDALDAFCSKRIFSDHRHKMKVLTAIWGSDEELVAGNEFQVASRLLRDYSKEHKAKRAYLRSLGKAIQTYGRLRVPKELNNIICTFLLYAAIYDKNESLVNYIYLRHPEFIPTEFNNYPPPLHIAISTRCEELITLIYASPKDLHYPDLFLIRLCSQRLYRFLVERGVYWENRQKDFITAARDWSYDYIEPFLSYGVDLDYTIDGKTALHHAAAAGNEKTVAWLLLKGADCQKRSGPYNALFFASEAGHVDVVSLLLYRSCKTKSEGAHPSAVHAAAKNGHISILQLLLPGSVSIDEDDNLFGTPLHYAATNGHTDAIEYLIRKGGNPWIRNSEGLNAIDLAIKCGHLSIAKKAKLLWDFKQIYPGHITSNYLN